MAKFQIVFKHLRWSVILTYDSYQLMLYDSFELVTIDIAESYCGFESNFYIVFFPYHRNVFLLGFGEDFIESLICLLICHGY